MGLSRCRVSYCDRSDIEHAAEVSAESLYLAVALAINRFKSGFLSDDALPDAMTKITVELISEITTSHTVPYNDVLSYARSQAAAAPVDMVKRARVRELLGV